MSQDNTPSVWTQLVLLWLQEQCIVQSGDCDESTVALIAMGFSNMLPSTGAIVSAATQSAWQPEKAPLRNVLEQFSHRELHARALLLLLGTSLARIWRLAPLHEQKVSITMRALEETGKRPDGRTVLAQLSTTLDTFFGLDVVHATQAKQVIDRHLGSSPGIIQ